jgi:asparagine synthase (glutamine-hydrolysing)
MQAIAGVLYPDAFQINHMLPPMLQIMKHRGKTSEVHSIKNLEVGVRGSSFIKNQKSTIYLAVDGALYETEKIKLKLQQVGFNGNLETPEQIVLAGYEHFGIKIIEEVGGEFTLVIIDHLKTKIFLIRDRIGKKPLYWFKNNRYFLFASELKAIIATGAVPQKPSLEALSSYLYFGYIPQDTTPIENVNKLLPAHYLELNFNGTYFIQSYWSFSSFFKNKNKLNPKNLLHEIDHQISQATQRRLPPHGERVGTFLSGGLGSSSIAYYVKELAQDRSVLGFTSGFSGFNEEELKAANEVAQKLSISHSSKMINPSQFLDPFASIAWHLDEPLADPNVMATWELAKLADEHEVQTVFSGMGSDELFAGHSRYSVAETHMSEWKQRILSPLPRIKELLTQILIYVYKPLAFSLLRQSRTNPWQFDYMKHNSLMNRSQLKIAAPKLVNSFNPEIFLHKFHHLSRIDSSISSFLYFDVKTRLPDSYILQYERLTAAFSLNWQAPILDHKIAELLASVPEPEFLTEEQTGSYLKKLMKDHLPENVIERPKKTRKEFLKRWLTEGVVKDAFFKLPNGSLVGAGLISKQWIFDCLDNLLTDPDAYRHLWAILSLEIWYRLYIDRPIPKTAPHISVIELLSL